MHGDSQDMLINLGLLRSFCLRDSLQLRVGVGGGGGGERDAACSSIFLSCCYFFDSSFSLHAHFGLATLLAGSVAAWTPSLACFWSAQLAILPAFFWGMDRFLRHWHFESRRARGRMASAGLFPTLVLDLGEWERVRSSFGRVGTRFGSEFGFLRGGDGHRAGIDLGPNWLLKFI